MRFLWPLIILGIPLYLQAKTYKVETLTNIPYELEVLFSEINKHRAWQDTDINALRLMFECHWDTSNTELQFILKSSFYKGLLSLPKSESRPIAIKDIYKIDWQKFEKSNDLIRLLSIIIKKDWQTISKELASKKVNVRNLGERKWKRIRPLFTIFYYLQQTTRPEEDFSTPLALSLFRKMIFSQGPLCKPLPARKQLLQVTELAPEKRKSVESIVQETLMIEGAVKKGPEIPKPSKDQWVPLDN